MTTIVPVTTDYTNRQIDVEFLKTIIEPVSIQGMRLGCVNVPKKVAGIQKMAQRYAIALLTELNTIKYDPNFGNSFLAGLFAGNFQTVGRIQAEFAFANGKAMQDIAAEDNNTELYGAIPDDERLVTATLINTTVDYNNARLLVRVQLASAAGDTYTYVIPVTT